jgi:tRNA(Ile)-lysidine synthase TilS/MesJ
MSASNLKQSDPPTSNVAVCKTCTLPSSVPSSRIDESGLCIYCRRFKGIENLNRHRKEYENEFQRLLDEHRKVENQPSYDILAAYSGGKDSSFTLDLLRNRYNLRILALTFDHGFVSPYAFENIRKVVETLGIDHITFKPDFKLIQNIFRFSIENEFHPPKALERASSLCNSCMGMVKFITLKIALEKRIPFIAYGWSPGQAPLQSAIMKNHPSFIKKAQDLFLRPLKKAIGPEVHAYFLDAHHLDEKENGNFPYNINPLAFLRYDEKKIYTRIRELGWKPPRDTDPNSTNCLLNAFANQVHIEKHHYNPYAMEMAELVREGVLPKEEVLHRTQEKMDSKIIENVKIKLGI